MFQDRNDSSHWRWRSIAANGEPVATSGEYFPSKSDAERVAETVKRLAQVAQVRELSSIAGALSQLRT